MKPGILGVNDLRRHIAPLQVRLKEAAARVVDSAWFVMGAEVERFETDFAAWCGAPHCIGVGNGTDALEISLRALGIGPGARVATVANAGMYGTAAILAVGAEPVFIDIDPQTCCMSAASLGTALARGPLAAIIVTHLYGRLADMAAILALAAPAAIPVIEDCAQAHGASRGGRRAGTFGTLATFSFYPTKNLGALGDGGAIVTSSGELAGRIRSLRQYGWTSRYHATLPGGRNSRLDAMQAAFLGVMLPELDGWNARRREIAALYGRLLRHDRVRLPPAAADDHVWHLYVVQVDGRAALRDHLAALGVPSDIHFPVPDHLQPALSGKMSPQMGLPETERACNEVLTLPCFPELTDAEVAWICDGVNGW